MQTFFIYSFNKKKKRDIVHSYLSNEILDSTHFEVKLEEDKKIVLFFLLTEKILTFTNKDNC